VPPNVLTSSCTGRGLEAQNVIGIPVAPRSAQCGRADNIGHHDRERIGRPATIRQRLPPMQLLKPRTCPSEYGGLRTQLASHVRAVVWPRDPTIPGHVRPRPDTASAYAR
jgi:hypothetical protein